MKAFEVQVPQAPVIRIANADHYVFRTKEFEVVGDINDFIRSLPIKQ